MNHGRNNIYVFKYEGKNIILILAKLAIKKSRPKNKPPPQVSARKDIHSLNHRAFKEESLNSKCWLAVISREVPTKFTKHKSEFPPEIRDSLIEIPNVVPNMLSSQMPPMRDIHHTIDLVLCSQLPTWSYVLNYLTFPIID